MSNPLTRADVEHVARLARLALSDEEIEQFTVQLGAILEHAASVAALDTADVPPTSHPIPLSNVLRPDEPRPGLDRDAVLSMAPAAEDGRFRVPRILGEEA
ncbi:MAG TPA: Asp-tRNA(Asn)/Glu-tRNA(Gln) amidotransferase subunit GatC [Acidimicrobiia bacterium]|nr:Asp-tRNA(Asn)/Glu-tRNA(Gln) amidotransferase subunit GatC [Acidimicrobiia bacterium]